ncbi:MAG: ATP-dependent metallopeptidase FtsH/Yme1/Tma family protein [Deltaproteobacteria bacterium]|nr:ATP-dependent metallopeptidase FtsH/Yme1/Tma family protein [Deltaproteobacteria bacterium]
MSPFYKNLVLWLVISLMMILLFNLFNQPRTTQEKVIFSDFLAALERGEVKEVTIQGHNITGRHVNRKEFKTFAPPYPDLVKALKEKDVKISAKPEEETPWYMTMLVSWFPMILLIGFWLFFMRQMQAGGTKAMSFGKARAKLLTDTKQKVTFVDVAGIEESKEELQEIIEFLRDPKKFTKLGGRIPKGVLLVGPPGTGKTLLARAIAGEANVPFFSISGSDFVEMFVGVGASRVRDLFIQGKKQAPCIIFIDEIDAVGRHRGAGLGGGHDEREQTLNQLLVEMDGFESNEGVIIIAATNRPDVLDPALLRPGRFDRQVVVPRPDVKGREEILKVHTRKTPLADDVSLTVLSRGTPGFTGADLENLVNEAALLAARRSKTKIEMTDFEASKDKVLMGVERRTMIISEEEKRLTAYHEAGHTLVAKFLPSADPIHKVSIIPRGQALGITQQLPAEDKHTLSREYILNKIAIFLGGRVAEELVLHTQTTGAGNDLEMATEWARKMVCDFGMSDKMGPVTFGKKEEHIFLGKEIAQPKDFSEKTAMDIDTEIRRIVLENYNRAKEIILREMDRLHRLASALLEKEVLTGEEINEVLGLKPSIPEIPPRELAQEAKLF